MTINDLRIGNPVGFSDVADELDDFVKDKDGLFISSTISTSSGTLTKIADTAINVNVASGDYVFLSGLMTVSNTTGNASMRIGVMQNGVSVASGLYELFNSDGSGLGGPAVIQYLLKTPATGSVEYALAWLSNGGTATFFSSVRMFNVSVFKRA